MASCRITENNGITEVYNEDGTQSQLYSEAIDRFDGDVKKALGIWGASQRDNFQTITGKNEKNATVDDVLRYMSQVDATDYDFRLSEEERRDVVHIINNSQFETMSELYDELSKIFRPNGYFEIDRKRAIDSGLYTEQELEDMDYSALDKMITKIGIESSINEYTNENRIVSGIKDTSKPKDALQKYPFVTENEVIQYMLDNELESLEGTPYSFVGGKGVKTPKIIDENGNISLEELRENNDILQDSQKKYLEENDFDENGNVKPEVIEEIRQERERIERETKENGTWLKAPNGQPTNLTPEQYVTVRMRRFKNWFGDWENNPENASRVVDENGEPLVVAHSTNYSFNTFKNKQENDSGWLGSGYYFFGDRSLDGQYGANVKDSFLNIKDPYFITDEEVEELSEKNNNAISKQFTQNIEEQGYDGVYYNGNFNEEWVAYNPNQIKSATENVGTFSTESNDIRYQIISEKGAQRIEKYYKNLQKAKELRKKGVSLSDISDQTGWYYYKGDWKMFSNEAREQFKLKEVEPNKEYRLYEVIENGKKNILFKIYPSLADTKVTFKKDNIKRSVKAVYNPKENSIFLYNVDGGERAPILSHEISHAIQTIEDLPRGGNLKTHIGSLLKKLGIFNSDVKELPLDVVLNQLRFIKNKNNKNDVDKAISIIKKIINNDDVGLHHDYLQIMGEIDAHIITKAYQEHKNGQLGDTYEMLLDDFLSDNKIDENSILKISGDGRSYSIINPNKKTSSTPQEVTRSIIDRLKQSGLANNVTRLNTEQLNEKLKELGISEKVRKQITLWHGTIKEIKDNILLTDKSEHLGELMGGLYLGERDVAMAFANIDPFGGRHDMSKMFKVKVDESLFPIIDMKGNSPTSDMALQKYISRGRYEKLLEKKRKGEIKGIKLINAPEHIMGESPNPTQYVVFDKSVVENTKVFFGEQLSQFNDVMFNKNIDLVPNGFVVTENGEKNVYLNSDNLNPNTPIHEFGHLYLDSLKENKPDVYNAGLSLIEKNKEEAKPYIDYVNTTQPDLEEGSEKWKNEVLAQIIGDRGENLLNSKKNNSIKQWLSDFWNAIKNILGLSHYTANEVSDMSLAEFGDAVSSDLLSGEKLFDGEKAEQNFKKWAGNNKIVQGSEVQNVKTGEPTTIHATTSELEDGMVNKLNIFPQNVEYNEQPELQGFSGAVITEAKRYKKIPKTFIDTEGNLTIDNKTTFTTIKNTMLNQVDMPSFNADNDFLNEIDPEIWMGNIKEVEETLQNIEKRMIDSNIDIIGIKDIATNRESVLRLMGSLKIMLETPTMENMDSFATMKDDMLGIETSSNVYTQKLPFKYSNLTVVQYNDNVSPNDAFKEHSLVKLQDNYYQSVEVQPKKVMYEKLYKDYMEGNLNIPQQYLIKTEGAEKEDIMESLRSYVNSRDVGFETTQDTNEDISLIQLAYNHTPLEYETINTATPENVEYLKTEFVSDFYKYFLREKLKNSDIYNKKLKYFAITDSDIVYNGIEKLDVSDIDYTEELKQYAFLKKSKSGLESIIEDVAPNTLYGEEDLEALNRPWMVKNEVSNAKEIGKNNEILIGDRSNDLYVKHKDKLYRKVVDVDSVSAYREINLRQDNIYYLTNRNFNTDIKDTRLTVMKYLTENKIDNNNLDIETQSKNVGRKADVNNESLSLVEEFGIEINPITNKERKEFDSCSI